MAKMVEHLPSMLFQALGSIPRKEREKRKGEKEGGRYGGREEKQLKNIPLKGTLQEKCAPFRIS
jgi:hypothetical protein